MAQPGNDSGAGRRTRVRLLLRGAGFGVAVLGLALAFSAPFAGAAHKEPIFDFCSFGGQGGQCSSNRGLAVNELGNGGVPAGTVYLAEFGNNRVQSFDANGNFLRAWGWDVIQAGKPGDIGAGFEICEVAEDCKAGVGFGSGAGQLNGPAGGIEVNQTTGDVYVVDRGNSRVQRFSATGGVIDSWGSAGEEGGEFSFGGGAAGVGIDSSGNVYVADSTNHRLQKFDPEGNFLAAGGWDVDATTLATEYEVCTVAANCKAGAEGNGEGQFGSIAPSFLRVSPSGEVYAVDGINGKIVRLGPNLELVDAEFAPGVVADGGTPRAVAVDGSTGHVLLAKGSDTNITEIDPATEEEVHQHPAEGSNWWGLAINSATGRLYAAQNGGAFVRVIDEEVVLPHPTVEPPEFTSWTRATLKGTVDPEGAELTACQFKYGISSANQTASCAETPAEIGDGTDPVPVHVDVSGLTPNGTQYDVHRLFAANSKAQAETPDLPFETPEVVITEPATEVSGTGATLNGTVNPLGNELEECRFDYLTEAAAQENEAREEAPFEGASSVSCAQSPAEIGTGSGDVAVDADIGGLKPGTAYRFRLLAANPLDGAATGDELSFQTLGPAIEAAWAEDVELSEATLKAEIDPEGKPTVYRFEYGAAGPCSANPCTSVPVPDGAVGEDSEAHEVSAVLRGLAPGTAYHYRAVASNADAVNEGPDRLLRTYAPPSFETDCPNQAFRTGPSAALPDCRAYEMVSPTDKGGGDIVAIGGTVLGIEAAYREASADGERVTYTSKTAFGDAQKGSLASQYLSTREGAGWSTHGLNPPLGAKLGGFATDGYTLDTNFRAFGEDLCTALVRDLNETPLVPEALAGHTNLYVRDNCEPGAGNYTALTRELDGAAGPDLGLDYGSFSRAGGHVLFGAGAPLAVDAGPPAAEGGHQQIYDYDLGAGELRLVSVLPGGEAAGTDAGVGAAFNGVGHGRFSPLARAVSRDGARIFWTSGGTPQIYARVGGATTVQLTSGFGVRFLTAAADGSTAVYRQGTDLFEFDLDVALAEEGGGATPAEAREAATSEIAGEAGGVVAASQDLASLYFTSKEVLDPEPNAEGDSAIPGEYNIYLRRGGEEAYVATVSPLDATDSVGNQVDGGANSPFSDGSRATADGRYLAFMSNRPLTGYDNTDAATREAASEVFRYDAETGELLCVSCKPSGARPEGRRLERLYGGGSTLPQQWVAAWLPTPEWATNEKRVLSASGERIIFNAYDDLALRDVNRAQDVYQWEAPGTGSCGEADPSYSEQNGGCVSLVSSGRDPEDAELLDASAGGSDVFFTTAASLDEARDPGNVDVYDAREGGGFPPPPPEPPPCVGDACQQVPAPPEAEVPASAIFEGSGNVGANLRCRTLARRATRLSRQARRMVRASRRAQAIKRKRRQRRRGRRLKVRATRLRRNARRCRQIERRAGR